MEGGETVVQMYCKREYVQKIESYISIERGAKVIFRSE